MESSTMLLSSPLFHELFRLSISGITYFFRHSNFYFFIFFEAIKINELTSFFDFLSSSVVSILVKKLAQC